MSHRSAALAALLVTLSLAACGDDHGGGTPGVGGVVPLPAALDLPVGDVAPLAAVVLPDPGADQAVTWMSDDAAVARVAGAGSAWTVRAVAAGTARLTVRSQQDPTRSATVDVQVHQPPTLAFTTSSALLQAPGALAVSTGLRNAGDRAATGVRLAVRYELGGAGWLTVTPAAAAPFDLAPGADVALEVTADPTGLASGLHAAVVEPEADPGVLFGGNPFTVVLTVP